MPDLYDVAAIGNAIVDVIAPADDAFLSANALDKGAMMLVDAERSAALYGKMAKGVETSGGSAGNTIAGVASFGGKAAYLGKVADDQLGETFTPRCAPSAPTSSRRPWSAARRPRSR